MKTIEEFIYDTLKSNTNHLKSTEFWVRGIKRKIPTKEKIKEAMLLRLIIIKKCKVTEDKYLVNYETFKWDKIN